MWCEDMRWVEERQYKETTKAKSKGQCQEPRTWQISHVPGSRRRVKLLCVVFPACLLYVLAVVRHALICDGCDDEMEEWKKERRNLPAWEARSDNNKHSS